MNALSRGNPCLRRELLLFLCFLVQAIPTGSACPKSCACYVPAEVHCTFRYLTAIPGAIQPTVERMNLGYNSLSVLKEHDFSGLRNLELLMLHSNTIHKIEDKAFDDLQSLQVLKMSYNRVKEINKETLQGLKSLVRLHMDHNRIEFINPEAFYGLTALQLVQLEGNLLQQLHPDTFVTLRYSQIFKVSSVKNIYLSDNALSSLPASIFSHCTQLENLYLHGNPWSCDCRMEWFVDWAEKNTGILKCKRDRKYARGQLCPVCESPAASRGKILAQVPRTALSCTKPWIYPHLKQKNITVDEGEYSPVTSKDFIAPIGLMVMNMTDQFHNDASVVCTVQRPSGMENLTVIHDEDIMTMSVSVATSLICNIDYEHIQKLWRILATYSDSPMRLERGLLLAKTPEMIYRYQQRRPGQNEDEVFTAIETEIKANPAWLMQGEVTLQLDRTTTTFSTLHVKYTSTVQLRMENKAQRKDRYSWAMIKRDNLTKTEHSVLTGGVADLNCQTWGDPKPSIDWILSDGSKVRAPYNSEDRRIVITDSGRLTLRAADTSDSGLYRCIATNYLDADVLTFRITVLSPDVEADDVNGVQLSYSLGDSLLLDCESSGNPKASIQWILPDHTVLDRSYGNKKIYENGTLGVQELTQRDRGFYRCLAGNYLGVDMVASQITISGTEKNSNVLLEGEGSGSELESNSEESESHNELTPSGPSHKTSQESRTITSDRPYPRHRFSHSRTSGDITQRRHGPSTRRRNWGARRIFGNTSKKVDPQKWEEFMKRAQKGKTTEDEEETQTGRKNTKTNNPVSEISGDEEVGSGESLSEEQLIVIPSTVMTSTVRPEVTTRLMPKTTEALTVSPSPRLTTSRREAERNAVTPVISPLYHSVTPSAVDLYALERSTNRPLNLPVTVKLKVTDSTSEMRLRISGDALETVTDVTPLLMMQYPNVTMMDSPGLRSEPVIHTSTDPDGQTTFTAVTTTEHEQDEITFHTTQRITSPRIPAGSTIISHQQIHIIPPNKQRVGRRRNFPNRRRVFKPSRINDIHAYLNKLKKPTEKHKGNSTVPSTVELTTDNPAIEKNENSIISETKYTLAYDTGSKPKPNIHSSSLHNTEKPTMVALENPLLSSTTLPPVTKTYFRKVKSTTQPPTTDSHFRSEGFTRFMTSADAPVLQTTQDPRELERNSAHTDKLSSTIKPTTRPSKVIRGRIPWEKLFGTKQGQKELLSRLRKPVKLTTTTETLTTVKTTPTTAPARTTTLFPTTRYLVPLITSQRISSGKTPIIQPSQTSPDDFSGSSFTSESQTVSRVATASSTISLPGGNQKESVGRAPTTAPSFALRFSTTTEISPFAETLETPPTAMTATTEKRFEGSFGSASGSGGSSAEPVNRLGFPRRPIGGPRRIGIRRRRPGKKITVVTPNTKRTMVTESLTTSPSRTVSPIRTNIPSTTLDPTLTIIDNRKSTTPSISKTSGGDTTKDSEKDSWRGPTRALTTSRPRAYTTTARLRTTTTKPTTVKTITTSRSYTTSQPRTTSTASSSESATKAIRINTDVRLPPGRESKHPTPSVRKVQPTVFSHKDSKSGTRLGSNQPHPKPTPSLSRIRTKPSESKQDLDQSEVTDRTQTMKFDTLIIPTTEQGYTTSTVPFSSNMDSETSHKYDQLNGHQTTTSNMIGLELSTGDMPSKPRIIGGNAASFTVLSNSDAFLPCEPVGHPEPTISWKRFSSGTGSTLTIRGKMGKFEMFKNGTLLIQNANIKDRGQYLCLAENDHGSDKLLVMLSVVSYPSRILEPKVREIKSHTGDTVEVKCRTDGRPTPVVSWILANQTQVRGYNTDRGRVSVTADGTLVIQQVTVFDRGHYKCIASNPAGADTATVRLQVVAAPPGILEEKRQLVNVVSGESLKLPCTAQGSPQPTVHWVLFDGTTVRPLNSHGNKASVLANGTLLLRGLAGSDSGMYECIATSSTGSERRVVSLTVEQTETMPHIVELSQRNTELNYGGRLWLNCTAVGEPTPKILWRLPSKALVDQVHRMGSRIHVLDNGTLIIDPVSEKDAGDYLCIARNKIGDDLQLMKVSVSMKPAKIMTKPLGKKQVPYGNDLKVDCKASGSPEPEISWGLPDGTVLNSVMQSDDSRGRTRRYILFDNGTLYFNKIGMTEEGDYTCYAENTLGKDEMHVHISVLTAAPRIRPSSRTYARVKPGGNVRFDCEAVGEPKPKILWMLPSNDMIAASNDRYLMHVNGSLDIRDVKLVDAGEYVCMARNAAGDDRKVYKLDIDGNPPVINGYRQNRTVIKDTASKYSRKLIDCRAEGSPPPKITWIMPDNIFLSAPYYGSRINVHPNGTLEIRNVRPTDTAEFICMARNDGGEAVMVVQLEVSSMLRRPIFKNPFNERVVARLGKTTVLNCSADGHPTPEISWLLPNGTRFTNDARTPHHHLGSDGNLVIYNPSREDTGKYRCSAKNKMGYIEKLVVLEVGQRPYIVTRPRGIIRSVSGESLFLHCLTDGSPRPTIYWTVPGGQVLSRPQVNGRFHLLENGTLVVRETTFHDRGNYLCRAKNDMGEAALTVPVIIIAYPPRITNGPPSTMRAAVGVPVQLNCMAIGIPKPEISWELPDRSELSTANKGRPTGTELLHPQGTLVIQRPTSSDSGAYKCIAKNHMGTDSRTTYIRVM
ncbi:immunoglobulin superfamily member 10 isoform X2 [Anguilla anguilla]|uniref:immunoglobulin superfamily member 10 isoform X2 n=1 Tax=Anguilla anguilla TaxID=7936 RepID=UPI0015AB00AB|nr:immunoglobulin superfamily member 10 isoform X2 [Anguilla anguilla]